jgi:hypothetical protein
MKFLTLILTTIILFLAVKPGIDLIALQSGTEQSCCAGNCEPTVDNKKSSDQEHPENDCSGKSCNPFQSCCMSVLYCLTKTTIELSKPEIVVIQNFSYQSGFTSQFASNFWQPPEIV